jgi:glycerophosphoryl diester phosphodiesterase
MTLSEVKTLDACYEEKFGDRYKGQGVTIPTLEETLELAAIKRPDILFGVEIKEYTEENVDITVAMLKKYGVFDRCWFYAFNARIIKYLKTKYNARTMGYPDMQMKENFRGLYEYYDEIGLSMNFVKSELCDFYLNKRMPVHMYCADTEDDVNLCIEKGADLITANDLVPLMKILGRL